MEDGRTPELRRMMVEYGEQFWKSGWAPLYGVLGGNPLAAMPSLHFATSVTAAHVLGRDRRASRARSAGPTPRTLGVALVYLGEHYVVDLAAGLALAEGVRRARRAPRRSRGGSSARGAGDSRRGRAHEHDGDAPPAARRRPAAGGRRRGRGAPAAARHLSGRNLLVLCGFVVAAIAALYFLLPQLAGLEDTWHRIEDGSPCWIAARARLHASACSAATC